jgi:hypothetical protein
VLVQPLLDAGMMKNMVAVKRRKKDNSLVNATGAMWKDKMR